MKSFKQKTESLIDTLRRWEEKRQLGFPFLLFCLFILSYGIQAAQLGFVLDDWVTLYAHSTGGADKLSQYAFFVNRPNVAWVWQIGMDTLGYDPLRWQLFSVFWRFSAVLLTWLVWRKLWPQHHLQVSLAAALFAVYPIFMQQGSAMTFSTHWICLTAFSISILLMIYALENKRWRVALLVVSLLAGGVNLFTMEYFIGLEILRPVILWMLLSRGEISRHEKVKKTSLLWAPFVVLLVVYFFYRFFWMATPGYDRNTPTMLLGLLSDPINTLIQLAVTVFRDLLQAVFGSWAATIRPEDVAVSPVSALAAWLAVGAGAALTAGFIFLRSGRETKPEIESRAWYQSALPFGLLSVLAGFAPVWAIGESIAPVGLYNDRFSLAALSGLGLLTIGLLDWLSKEKLPKYMTVCLLIGLAVGYQFRAETVMRQSWKAQLNVYWQMKWRVPDLETPTAIYGEGVMAKYMGSWADVSAYNMLYPNHNPDSFENTWYFNLYSPDSLIFTPDTPISVEKMENLNFQGNSSDSLVFQMKGISGQCLWLVSEDDADNPFLSDYVKPALKLSNPGRVISDAESTLPAEIYGQEPAHNWCFYFQKADLAKQNQQWSRVIELWQEATSQGLKPNVAAEYMPFIMSALHNSDFELAYEISQKGVINDSMRKFTCVRWNQFTPDSDYKAEFQSWLSKINHEFTCEP